MISAFESFGIGFPKRDQKLESQLGWIALASYLLLSWLWLLLADAPWDDDVPTRFFNTQNAFNDPLNFVSLWNRPLFVLIFSIPAQLGKYSINVLMPLISALGAFFLWKGLLDRKVPFAWLVIPFFLFQPFFFGTSRVALTEPLAAVLIAGGFYFLGRKKWWAYALMGGLIPLARLELSPLLLFWLPPLIKEKQWKHLLWLGLPMVLWNIAGGIITGDYLYVLSNSLGGDNAENRYGHTPFLHYFERYGYVTGPVVFFLFLNGIVSRLRNKASNLWLEGQFLAGFALYVVFSWKLNMGNSAGFLRNLVPLTPFLALLAVEGWNQMIALLNKDGLQTTEMQKRQRISLLIASGVSLVLAAFVYNRTMRMHQILTETPDYTILVTMLMGIAAIGLIGWSNRKGNQKNRKISTIGSILMMLFTMGYTLITEPPAISDNAERRAVGIIADAYLEGGMDSQPTYANHGWFFWRTGMNPYDERNKRVTMENLTAAPIGSIVLWDVHYSSRLSGDVTPGFMQGNPAFVELLRIGLPARKEAAVLYQKTSNDPQAQEALSAKFVAMNQNFLPALTGRVFHLIWRGQFEPALQLASSTLEKADNDPDLWFAKGFAALSLGDVNQAVTAFENSLNIWPQNASGWYNLGMARRHAGMPDAALDALNTCLSQDPKFEDALFVRAGLRAQKGNLEGAIEDFSSAIKLDPKDFANYFSRAVTYSMMNKPQPALQDINTAVNLQPSNLEALFVKGRIEIQAGKKTEGCATLHRALAGGFEKAAEFIAKNCSAAPAASPTK